MLSVTKTKTLVLILGGLLLAAPLVSHACDATAFGCWLKTTLIWGINFMAYLIGVIGSLFLTLAASLVDLVVKFNIDILGSGSLVTTGFNISLNVVNLLFVLALILIAFGTILRLQAYGIKQLLAKLIIAAILINFSLAIAGLLLDFSHVFTKFFLSGGVTEVISGGATEAASISNSLAHSLQPQQFSAPPSFEEAERAASAGLMIKTISDAIFKAIFTWLMAIVLMGVAFMFFVRYFYVLILLILMPFAWFFWVIPEYSGLAKKWWDKFLEQVFFLPAAAFFIYLAIQLKQSVDIITKGDLGTASAAFGTSLGNDSIFKTILNQIIISGILVGGLIAAQKMGIAGAATAMGMAKWARGAAGKAVRAPAQYLGTAPTKATARGISNVLNSKALRWIPGAKGAVARLSGFGSRQSEVEDYQKNYLSSLTEEQFAKVQQTAPVGPIAKAALLAESAKRKKVAGLVAGITDPEKQAERYKEFAKAAQQANPGMAMENIPTVKELFKNAPHLVPNLIDMKKYTEMIDETTGKVIEPDVARLRAIRDVVQKANTNEAINYSVQALQDINVVMSLSNAKLGAIAASGSDKQREAILKTFAEAEKLASTNEKEWQKYSDAGIRIRDYINANPGLQSKTLGAVPGPEAPAPPTAPPKA